MNLLLVLAMAVTANAMSRDEAFKKTNKVNKVKNIDAYEEIEKSIKQGWYWASLPGTCSNYLFLQEEKFTLREDSGPSTTQCSVSWR